MPLVFYITSTLRFLVVQCTNVLEHTRTTTKKYWIRLEPHRTTQSTLMSEPYKLPVIGGQEQPRSTHLKPADDAYLPRPTDTNPQLFELLPDSTHTAPPYTVAGVSSDDRDQTDHHRSSPTQPSHAVTALYTPNGHIEYQQRVLACRLSLLDATHEYSDDIATYHERRVADEFADRDGDAYTDWVDASLTTETVNGHTRTSYTLRRPLLSYPTTERQDVHHPVFVRAVVVQPTSWGSIEIGAYLWPDPDPGTGLNTVTELTDTVTNRAARLPRPVVEAEWPLLYTHELSADELAAKMKSIITDLTADPSEPTTESGAAVSTLLDRFRAEYDVTEREARKILDVLKQQDAIADDTPGHIHLQ